jgi:hypothetical protein
MQKYHQLLSVYYVGECPTKKKERQHRQFIVKFSRKHKKTDTHCVRNPDFLSVHLRMKSSESKKPPFQR